jgi:hypothetical protein
VDDEEPLTGSLSAEITRHTTVYEPRSSSPASGTTTSVGRGRSVLPTATGSATPSKTLTSPRRTSTGSLEVGRLADLVVLSGDYFRVPVDDIRTLTSVLTMVGGRVVYGEVGFADLESTASTIPR